ncbi:MAG: hypothetical protein MUF64_17780 [Polyangiaceae bacterium]|nr:hypothetical protein [Polyangiaceae bacterium]
MSSTTLPPATRANPVLFWGGLSVAGLFTVVGTTTALLARQRSDKIKEQCPDLRCPPSLEGDIEARRTLSSASTTSFLFAGLGLGAMVLGLVLREEAPVQVQVGPAWLSVARTF